MADFFEIDFLDVETKKSGDAIPLRYEIGGTTYIHVVDGGFSATGDAVVAHVKKYYGNPKKLDHVVVTHPDGDHACGLQKVLEEFEIGTLWMLRPWSYASEIIHRFTKFSSVENLQKRLREIYPYIAELERIAEERGIPIKEPLQGQVIGAFVVLAPSRSRYLDLVVESEKTPEHEEGAESVARSLIEKVEAAAAEVLAVFKAALWGEEYFSPNETSNENEMSVVQFAEINGEKILLTGDAGRGALTEAADYAPNVGLQLPGLNRFQVPHHGSRRNVSTEVLDRWLGPKLGTQPSSGNEAFTAVISSALEDKDHPRRSVVRAMIHRGGKVTSTEGKTVCTYSNAPKRDGWTSVTYLPYPVDQEE